MGDESIVKPQVETGRAERIAYPPSPRLQRMRFIGNLLDQCITLPGGMRIGLDPIVGLVPAVGDLAATTMSLYLVYEAARLGLPKRILVRMLGNVALETLMGTFPVLGDLFDAVWKANMRNLRLAELHHSPTHAERSRRKIIGWTLGVFLLFVLGYVALAVFMLKAILSFFGF